jgi:hypothetical protein
MIASLWNPLDAAARARVWLVFWLFWIASTFYIFATVPVGTPILITVEDAADVAAFADYKVDAAPPVAAAAAPPPAPAAVDKAPVMAAAAPAQPVPPVPPAAKSSPPPPPPTPPPVAATAPSSSVSTTIAWGLSVVKTSPLAKSLAARQNQYVALYGTTGQVPILGRAAP